jgi:hypothetical protein
LTVFVFLFFFSGDAIDRSRTRDVDDFRVSSRVSRRAAFAFARLEHLLQVAYVRAARAGRHRIPQRHVQDGSQLKRRLRDVPERRRRALGVV